MNLLYNEIYVPKCFELSQLRLPIASQMNYYIAKFKMSN